MLPIGCLLGVVDQRRPLSLGPPRLPGVSEAIQIFGMRFFDQLALTVAKEHIAFIAARGDAPTWPMQAKWVTSAVGDHRR
jgi:hypothetical protein